MDATRRRRIHSSSEPDFSQPQFRRFREPASDSSEMSDAPSSAGSDTVFDLRSLGRDLNRISQVSHTASAGSNPMHRNGRKLFACFLALGILCLAALVGSGEKSEVDSCRSVDF